MSKIRVFIVDDHALLRSGLKMLIDAQPDMQVVGQAGDLREALEQAPGADAGVITLDLSMPGAAGVSGVEQLRRAAPAARVLVLTMHDDPAYVRTAIALGASGYVVKSAADTELVSAIRAVSRGRIFVDMHEASFAGPAGEPPAGPSAPSAPIESLSEREREILIEVAKGHTSADIAQRLGLSAKTVETYRARMMQKLGLRSRADIVRLAMECGLLGPGPTG